MNYRADSSTIPHPGQHNTKARLVLIVPTSQNLVTGVAHSLDILIHKPVLGAAACNMSRMAVDTSSSGSGGSLPAGKLLMPVIVPAFSSTPASADTRNRDLLLGRKSALGHLLVTLEAVSIANRKRHHRRLNGCSCIPLEGVTSPQQFGLDAAKNALPRVAANAKGILSGVIRS